MDTEATSRVDDLTAWDGSLLSTGPSLENMPIDATVGDIERRLRTMCLAMQSFNLHHPQSLDNISVLSQMFETFYEFVDAQADALTRLRMVLNSGVSGVSPNAIKTVSYSVQTPDGFVPILEHAGRRARKGARHG